MSLPASPYRRGTIVGGALAVAAVVAFGYHVEVVVAAPTERIEATARVPLREAALPPQTATRRVTVPTTGGVGTTHATGRVRLTYETESLGCHEQGNCPPPEIVVPAGTRIATCVPLADPCRHDVVFATVRPLRLRDVGFDFVEVRAVEPGSRGNVFTAGLLEVVDQPGIARGRITAFALQAEGGADAPSGIVSKADVDGAVEREQVAVLGEAGERLRAAAADRGLRVAAPKTDLQVAAEPPVGGAAAEVVVTLTATATGAGYREDELLDAARRALADARPPGRFPTSDDDPPIADVRVDGGHAVASVVAFVSAVDRAEVRRRTPRRLTGSAEGDLEAHLGVPVVIEGRPFNLPFTPVRGSGVKVRIDHGWDEKTYRR